DDVVAVVIARRKPQCLDHPVRGRVIAVAGVMRNADAHAAILPSGLGGETRHAGSPSQDPSARTIQASPAALRQGFPRFSWSNRAVSGVAGLLPEMTERCSMPPCR